MAEIPEDLIVKILLLLPALTLLRFRCVSKKWRDLIDSPNFVKSHLGRPNKAHSMMVLFRYDCAYYVDLTSVCNAIDPPVLKQLAYPWHGKDCNYGDVAGPYNGLFGIYTSNPGPDEVRTWSWGFGYDSNSDDYKVVIITANLKSAWDDTDTYIVCVYSLKSGLWKRIGNFPYFLADQGQPVVCVDDALHWKVEGPDRSYLIVALHLGKLEYHLVPQPLLKANNFNLGVLDGCLYAIYDNMNDHGFDLLVMKEYGVEESWTLLIASTGWRKSFW
ncbi:hypothetical protein DH2020_039475 [Rehmannia glutinosa]|uniref:F-box domain-containing protein n=1 Tax=Rehmannia glutinosa TaxID=99300 RepID=A0ABR0UW87_REHGL